MKHHDMVVNKYWALLCLLEKANNLVRKQCFNIHCNTVDNGLVLRLGCALKYTVALLTSRAILCLGCALELTSLSYPALPRMIQNRY